MATRLPIVYCVICGNKAAPCLFLCAPCANAGQKIPNNYDSEHQYHCSFCGEGLKDWWDFDENGFFKSKDLLCLGCEFVSQQRPNQDMEYLPRAVEYIDECLRNRALPDHIRYNFEEHKKRFASQINR